MEVKLLTLKGIPAVGKSSFALNLVKENPTTWVRICRDDIREMFGEYWVPQREKLVTCIEHDSIKTSLLSGYNVVVDATNLNPKTISQFKRIIKDINDSDEDIEVIYQEKLFKISLWKALWRDFRRGLKGERKVGSKVIRNFYKRYNGFICRTENGCTYNSKSETKKRDN